MTGSHKQPSAVEMPSASHGNKHQHDHHRNSDKAAAAATAGRAAEVAVEGRHVLGITRVTGTVRANTRRERQSSHCMNRLHSWREPDEKLEGSFFLTSTRQKSILRGSEIFGYDEKEYPERMLQRAAGWCKAVQGVRGKILSELSG